MQSSIKGISVLFLCLITTSVHAVGAGVGYGVGVGNLRSVRMAASWDLGPWASTNNRYHWHGYWEASGARWRSSKGNLLNGRSNASTFTTGPQIRLERSSVDRFGNIPFLELGVGLSWMSKKNIAGRRMDMHFQFEDRAGIGVRWGEQQAYETIFTAYHYSNASLGKHNSGLNLVMLSFGKRFN